MELKIDVIAGEYCGFALKDITEISSSGYQDESEESFSKGSFKYSDTVSVIILSLIKSNEIIYNNPIIVKHEQYDYINVPVTDDGHYKLNYIVIPTLEWFEKNKTRYKITYFSDGIKIYKYVNEEIIEVSPKELIEINIVDTSISRITEDYISICLLKQCFIDACKKIFDLRGFDKCEYIGKIDSQLIYRRDLLWMAINTISYLMEFGQLDEAERIIELIHGCNGICKSRNRKTISNGCGCS